MPTYGPGYPVTLEMEFYDQVTGVLTDATAVQLDITYGATLDSGAPDYAGPYTLAAGQITHVATGVYTYTWSIPGNAPAGIYIANWTITYAGGTFIGFENITVGSTGLLPPPSGDIGFWSGSLTYNGIMIPLGGVDANGTAWTILSVDGLDGAPVDGQVIQRAGDHGGFATPQFYAPRPITLKVQASALSQALRDTARAMLQQAVPVSDLATLLYNEPVPKTLMVRRSGRLTEAYPYETADVVFTIGLIAPDPRKYGATSIVTATVNNQMLGITYPITYPVTYPAQAAPGAATVTNAGNFETRPMISITGPITAPAVYNQTTGQTVSFSTLAMAATDTLTLDLLNKVAYLDGAPIGPDLWSSWWVLEPGDSQIVLQGDGPGATITITTQDAWM